MASRKEKEFIRLQRELKFHKGEWLTDEVVDEFRRKAESLSGTNGENAGERRKLCLRLMNEYGVLECEALNIINGFGGRDYVNKYHRIRHQIPLIISKDKVVEDEDME